MPKSVRQKLNLKAGDKIDFVEDEGRVIVRVQNGPRAIDLAGSLKAYAGAGTSLDDIDTTICEAVAEDDDRIKREWRDGPE